MTNPSQEATTQPSDYDFLTQEQWEKVCRLLTHDLNKGIGAISFVAPANPGECEESYLTIDADNENMWWTSGTVKNRKLSDVIIQNNDNSISELRRAAYSLANTLQVLNRYIFEKEGPYA